MNCANHPEAAVSAYCQNCGKPLCVQCVRPVAGVIYCEQCLAARLGVGAVPGTAQNLNNAVNDFVASVAGGVPPGGTSGPNPGIATLLGFIPGVGAFYNGQFVKGLIHVLVFVVLIGIADHHGIFGIFIPAWILYQAFDAHHTAKARRDGLPLPDPLGLNDLASKLGFPGTPTQAYSAPPPVAGFTAPPAAGAAYPPFGDPAYPPYTAVPPGDYVSVDPAAYPPPPRRHEPIGAIVLIGLGLLFLFNTLGFLRFDWIDHAWPLFIIGLGAWLLVRRSRESVPPPPPAPPAGGAQ
jgi:hypothetical protein